MKRLRFGTSQSAVLFSVSCLLFPAIPLSAQTLYVPGGTVGSISGGNVGIGTSSPGSLLNLDQAGANYGNGLRLSYGGHYWEAVHDGASGLTLGYDGVDKLVIARSGNSYFPSGNLGIGTSSPQGKLHVIGVGRFGLMDSSINNMGGILVASGTGVGGARQYWIGASNPTSHNNNMFQISDYDGGTNTPLMTIYGIHAGAAVGNVGIGTTSPSFKLNVAGDVTYPNDVTAGGAQFSVSGLTAPTKRINIGYDTTSGNGFGFIAAGNQGVTWTSLILQPTGGNVGIGTTTPGAKLDVYGRVQIDNDGQFFWGASANQGLLSWDTGKVRILARTGNDLSLGSNNVGDQLYIKSGGNVGIGTTSPSHKLAVNGTIRAKEVIVDTGWSDYVFKPGYPLASLSEVEAHIKAHGHLPGVPSEAQVAKEGVTLGDMQSKLLAKIEELTLHQIAQEKQLASFQSDNAALRARVSTLEQASSKP